MVLREKGCPKKLKIWQPAQNMLCKAFLCLQQLSQIKKLLRFQNMHCKTFILKEVNKMARRELFVGFCFVLLLSNLYLKRWLPIRILSPSTGACYCKKPAMESQRKTLMMQGLQLHYALDVSPLTERWTCLLGSSVTSYCSPAPLKYDKYKTTFLFREFSTAGVKHQRLERNNEHVTPFPKTCSVMHLPVLSTQTGTEKKTMSWISLWNHVSGWNVNKTMCTSEKCKYKCVVL